MNSSKFLVTVLRLPLHLRCTLYLPQGRLYHSYEYDQSPPFTSTEQSILSNALSHVPDHGFTSTALTRGARDAGYLDVSANLIHNDPFTIINYHLVTQRLALANGAPSRPQSPNEVSTNIRKLALRRLHANKPIIHRWQEALALLSTAGQLPTALRELARLSDEILFLAGSTTVTSAWYTNRAALAALYASVEMFMTTDTSKDFIETEEFLTRRLDEAEKAKTFMSGVAAWTAMQTGGFVDGLRSKGVWI